MAVSLKRLNVSILDYHYTDGTFTQGMVVFTAGPGFPIGQNRVVCFDFIIMDDAVREDDESFDVVLALDQNIPQPGVIINPNTTEINILDDDGNLK